MNEKRVYTYQEQRVQIQTAINRYFQRRISISPRAMAALQGNWYEYWEELDIGPITPAVSVFEALLSVSPCCLSILYDSGVEIEQLFQEKNEQNGDAGGLLDESTLDEIFRGIDYDKEFTDQKPALARAAKDVRRTKRLTETDLFKSFLQTAYIGPTVFRQKVDLELYMSEVGSRLRGAGFGDADSVTEYWAGGNKHWNGQHDIYRARSTAAERFLKLARMAKEITVSDPSHDNFQFALWQDSKGRIRLKPFGVGSLGSLEPQHLRPGQPFMFRSGIFQPVSSLGLTVQDTELLEFEDMLNSRSASESDYQRFLSSHPDFLTAGEYKTVHPQLVLQSQEGKDLIPDFMLEPLSSEFCDILELKMPHTQLARRPRNGNRIRFSAKVSEAIAQLIEYRRYFEDKENRAQFHRKYGLKAYYPSMILVIGRRQSFKDDIERQELKQLLPKDLHIWTYDDLLVKARRIRSCNNA